MLAAAGRSGTFTLKAFRRVGDDGWSAEFCELKDLVWPTYGLAHLPDRELGWILEFRRRWATSRRLDGTEPLEEAGLVAELLALAPVQDVSRRDVASVLDFLASVHEGRPIASAQDNLRALVHTFLEPDRRRRYARLARYALASCKRQDVLDDFKVARKLSARMRESEQETRGGPMGRIALLLYPEWFRTDGNGAR